MLFFKKTTLIATALSFACFGNAAQANTDFPQKTVTLYSAFSVGSGPDVVLRILSQELGKIWGQPVIVENRSGSL